MSCYMLATGKVRHFLPHGYTQRSILDTRLRENTTSAALTLTLVLPFLQRVNKSVEQHIDAGVEVTSKDIRVMVTESGVSTLYAFAELSSRTACQAFIASYLIGKKQPLLDSIVFSWDMYPRLHQKYVGDLLAKIYLPRFIATLLGPKPHTADLDFFRTKELSSVAVFEDCLKRNAIGTAADVIVDTAKALLFQKNKVKTIFNRLILHTTVLVSRGTGAVAGYALKEDVGEYWGERVGSLLGAIVAVQLMAKVANSQNPKRKI